MNEAVKAIHTYGDLECKLGLERIEELLRRLSNPHKGIRYIHVTGTNGKGSVCRYIYSVLKENGYKAGIFTSPHIQFINERIEYDGMLISDEDLELCAEETYRNAKEMAEDGFEPPTTFEIVAAVAFLYFKKIKAEYVVLEVGLGGRGDATNIIENPLISVITSVSLDHTDLLGNTLPLIAAEKAGIIKEGSPVVANVYDPEAAKVVEETAGRLKCDYYDVAEVKFKVVDKTLESYVFDTTILGEEYKGLEIKMKGRHQIRNTITALTAIEVLRRDGLPGITKDGIYRGFLNSHHIGRFEVLKENPYIIIDGAHNEKGAEELKNTMKEHFPGKKILIVTGMLKDKDVDKMLGNLYEVADDFIATQPDNPRRMVAEEMAEKLKAAGKNCLAVLDPASACEKAEKLAPEYDAVVFAGSLYLLGDVRGYFV